ncbi:hypothetical protein INT48_009620, partial [Thamnidium elegans]
TLSQRHTLLCEFLEDYVIQSLKIRQQLSKEEELSRILGTGTTIVIGVNWCPASMKVTCYKDDPSNVVFTFQKQHNHTVGTKEDFCFLPVSKRTKEFIMQKRIEGYECRDVRVSIQRQLNTYIQSNLHIIIGENYNNNYAIIHRDQIIDQNEVYNQYKKIQETAYKKNNDQYDSVHLWMQSLSIEKGYDYYLGSSFSTNFTFAFLRDTQNYRYQKILLYTVVVRHPVTVTGYTVAYCFTTSHGVSPIVPFLKFLKSLRSTNIQKITIDVSNVRLNVINIAFPEARGIKADDVEKITSEFTIKLAIFLNCFGKYTDLIRYLRTYYYLHDSFMRWASCYQPDIYTNMETNNYVESWHNQLKTTYLKRRPNRRVSDVSK